MRFVLLWSIASVVSYTMIFVATRRDRKNIWRVWKRVLVSIIGGALIVLPMFLINNISGV